jgi:hypothetical protein
VCYIERMSARYQHEGCRKRADFNALVRNASPFLASSRLYCTNVLLSRSWNSALSLGFSAKYSSSWVSVGLLSRFCLRDVVMELYSMSGRVGIFGEGTEVDSRL